LNNRRFPLPARSHECDKADVFRLQRIIKCSKLGDAAEESERVRCGMVKVRETRWWHEWPFVGSFALSLPAIPILSASALHGGMDLLPRILRASDYDVLSVQATGTRRVCESKEFAQRLHEFATSRRRIWITEGD
jgi:hypothetical protein